MTSGSRVLSYEELRSIAIEFGGFNPNTDGSIGDAERLNRELTDAAGIITLATDVKPISEWQRDLKRRAEAWIADHYKRDANMDGTVNEHNIAWLIESVDGVHPDPIYFCGPGDWCGNPNHAHKFATRDAAEANRLSLHNPDAFKVTEHIWS